METNNLIQQLYIAYYGRPADPAGLTFWSEQLAQNGGNLDAIMDAFGTSEEFDSRFGQLSTSGLVNNLYQQVFGRNVDEEGLTFYTDLLDSGKSTLAKLATDVVSGAQNNDVVTIQNRVDVANEITQNVADRGLRFSADDIDAAGQVISNVTENTDVASYIQSTVQGLLNTLPVAEQPPEGVPGERVLIELDQGSVVFSFDVSSTLGGEGAVVQIPEAIVNEFITAKDELFASSTGNFGDIITLKTADNTLELVTIEFMGDSPLRDYGTMVGYDQWIDFALYNGELVTPELVNVSNDEFFWGGNDLESYFGYEWPDEGPQEISRADGQNFSLEIEVFDALGISNLDALMNELIA